MSEEFADKCDLELAALIGRAEHELQRRKLASKDKLKRVGSGCLDSSPRILSGFLPGFAERGVLSIFVGASGGRSPTRASTKSR